MFFDLRLHSRLMLLVLGAMVPLFGLALAGLVLNSDEAVRRATENIEFSASLVAANQQRVSDAAEQVLTVIAAAPGIADGNNERCQNYMTTLHARLPAFANLGIIGVDGYVRCNGVANNGAVFAGDRGYFQEALASRRLAANGYVYGRLSAKPVLIFALPVTSSQGTITAVAFAAVKLSELAGALADAPLPRGASVVVTDRQGIVVAASPANPDAIGRPVSSPVLQAAQKAGVAGVSHGPDANGAAQIYAYQPSSKSHAAFFVAVSIDKSALTAPARQRLMLLLLLMAVMAAFGSWLAWFWGGRTIERRTSEIVDATRKLQRGQLHTRIRTSSEGRVGELAQIADGVNQMAASLEELLTEHTSNYAALRETQRKLLDAQRLGCIGHWEFDLETRRISWSDEVYDLLGLAPGSFDGTHDTFLTMVHPDDRASYTASREAALAKNMQADMEYRIITANSGEVRWMHQRGKGRINIGGDAYFRAGVVQDITARKESELALTRSADLLRRTGQLAKVGGWEFMVDGRQLIVSTELLRLHDMGPDEVLGIKEARAAYSESSRPIFAAAVQAALDHGTEWDLELSLDTKTGRRIWVRTQGQAFVRDGKVYRLVGALQDITVQHESREHLRLLETSIANLNDIVLITEAEPFDEPGPRIVFVNDAFVRRTGYTREEVLGKSPRLLQGPKTQQAELARISEALRKWQPVRSELINYTKSGEEFWIEMDIVPIANATGWFTHWVSVERDITERKRAEQALAHSEQRYDALFDSAPVPMWVFDTATLRFIHVNQATVKAYGYSAAEFLDMTILDIRVEGDWAALHRKLSDARAVRRHSGQHRRKDGSMFIADVVSTPVPYTGREARFVVALDITAQRKAEREVQEYLFSLQRAADAAQAITWHQTLDGMLQEVAEQARGVVGGHMAVVTLCLASQQEHAMSVISLSEQFSACREVIRPVDTSGLYASIQKNNRALRMTQAELDTHPEWPTWGGPAALYPTSGGWMAVPMLGRSGQSIGLLQLAGKYEGEFTLQDEYVATELAQLAAIAIDNAQLLEEVSQLNTGLEQKVDERTRALARQEALFRALAEQAPQVVWTVDPKGRLTYLNRAWYDLVGGELSDWAGNRWFAAMHPDDLHDVMANWAVSMATEMPYVGTRRLLASDGSCHSMAYRASPVRDELGVVVFWVGIDADITEVKTIEAALRLSNQELEAFSYSVSHDLRSPLNTIDGFSRLLSKHLTGDMNDKGRHYLARIQAGVAQMGKLIEDLLSLAQVSRMQLRYEVIDLSSLSQCILDDWLQRDPDRQVTTHIEAGLQAQGDTRLVRVVLENLLGNAWKFTSQTANASIHVGQTLDVVGEPVFFVRDNGAGFDMAYADKLFTAFQRLHAASEFPGTGIGLATVSRVISRHGGQLWPESAPGAGATFFFTLPKVAVSG